MAALWTELPSEVFGYILDKLGEYDVETFLAASAICRDWRCSSSSWVSSISFRTYIDNCKKHNKDFLECSCFLDSILSVLTRSKSVSKLRMDWIEPIVCEVLGKCNWLGTLQELDILGVNCNAGKVLQVLRSCRSLSVLSLDFIDINTWDVPQDLILTNLKRLSIAVLFISNETIQVLMERVANLEYLEMNCYWKGGPAVINAPASVVQMELYFSKNLLVNAVGVKDMIIQAMQVELETPLLEELTLHFGTQIIKGSPDVRRVYMCPTEDSLNNIVGTLSSCVVLSRMKTLCISPGCCKLQNSGAFFEVMSKLTELEELEVNFNMVMQLSPEGHDMTVFLPKLKTLALDCSFDCKHGLAKWEDCLLEKFRSAWEYLKSVTPHAQVVIRNGQSSRLIEKVDLLQHSSRCIK